MDWLARLPYPCRDALRRWRGLLGMVLGVGLALGIGMTILGASSASVDSFSSDYRSSGTDLYAIERGGKIVAVLPGDTPGTIDQAHRVLAETRSLPGVKTALGAVTWSLEWERSVRRTRENTAELFATVGVDGDPSAIPGALKMDGGRWIRRSREIVLGPRLAREKGLSVGDVVRLSGRDFDVVGIGRVLGVGFNSSSLAFMDREELRRSTATLGDVINILMIDTNSPEVVRARVDRLGSLALYDPRQLVEEVQRVNASAVAMRWIMVVLTLAIAGMFVSNMLLRSVAERRIEFATLRAIGVPTRTVLSTVAAQAVLVSLAASAVGVGVASVFGWLINTQVAPQYGFEALYAADGALFAGVFALALGLGVVSGLYPARLATRIDPALVLREA